ncbi:MAG: DNA replication/repair protein RecF [Symbiobacteriaceae bacterium]|nr:DNA replication/repair protein RecF [Symbiobacteriaceae bacterium]
MYIEHLSLYNFRNYTRLELDLKPGLNLFLGDNAQGKTNLLEACYLLATARSHRTSRDLEMIKWEEREFYLAATLQTRHGTETLQMHFEPSQGKKVRLDGILQPRLSDLIGHLKVVFFAPEHLLLVKGEPGQRRRFLDILLSSLNRLYLYALSNYNRTLREKSILLKEEKVDTDLLRVYNQQLAENGATLLHRRLQAIDQLAILAETCHFQLESSEKLSISYDSRLHADSSMSIESLREALERLYTQKEEEEIRRRIPLFGPHRDDLTILLGGEEARRFASQGQQRSIVLSLKIAEARFIEKISDERPVLVLDDLFSELDPSRQGKLLDQLTSFGQTMISATYLTPLLYQSEKSIYQIQQGTVTQK